MADNAVLNSKIALAEQLFEELAARPLTLSHTLHLQNEMVYYTEAYRLQDIERLNTLISRLQGFAWEDCPPDGGE